MLLVSLLDLFSVLVRTVCGVDWNVTVKGGLLLFGVEEFLEGNWIRSGREGKEGSGGLLNRSPFKGLVSVRLKFASLFSVLVVSLFSGSF